MPKPEIQGWSFILKLLTYTESNYEIAIERELGWLILSVRVGGGASVRRSIFGHHDSCAAGR